MVSQMVSQRLSITIASNILHLILYAKYSKNQQEQQPKKGKNKKKSPNHNTWLPKSLLKHSQSQDAVRFHS